MVLQVCIQLLHSQNLFAVHFTNSVLIAFHKHLPMFTLASYTLTYPRHVNIELLHSHEEVHLGGYYN